MKDPNTLDALLDVGAATADMERAERARVEAAEQSMPAVVERARRVDRERARETRRLSPDELWTRCERAVDSMRRLALDTDERADLISDLVADRLAWSARTDPAARVGALTPPARPTRARSVVAYLDAAERALAGRATARRLALADALSVTDKDASPYMLGRRLTDLLDRSGRWRTVEAGREKVGDRFRPTVAHGPLSDEASDAPANGRKRAPLLLDSDGETDAAPSPWTRLLELGADPDAPALAAGGDAAAVGAAIGAALLFSGPDPNVSALLVGALDYWRPVRGRETDWAIDGAALAQQLGVSPDSARQRVARGKRALLDAVAVVRVPMLGTVLEMPATPRQQRDALRELLRDALSQADLAAPERDPDGPALALARRAVDRCKRDAYTDAAQRVPGGRLDAHPVRPSDALSGPTRTAALLAWLDCWQDTDADLDGPAAPTPTADSYAPRAYAPTDRTRGAQMDPADRDPAPDPTRQQSARRASGFGHADADPAAMQLWQSVSRAGAYMDRYHLRKLAQGGAG